MKLPNPRRLPSGKWNCQVMINGQRISVTKGSKSDCIASCLQLKGLAEKSPKMDKYKVTWASAVEEYISDNENVLSPSTYRTYRGILKNRFCDIQNKDLTDYIPWQKVINAEAKLVSPKTLKNSWALYCTVMRVNGMEVPKVNLPQIPPADKTWLDMEQIKTLMAAIEGDKYECCILLALHGLRRSEILAMDKSSLDTEKGLIRVSGAVVEAFGGGLTRKSTNKNATSHRIIPIMIPRLMECEFWIPKSKDNIRVVLQKVCKENGLPEVTLHSLRHSFASLCLSAGIPAEQCMKWGGWSNITTMRNIYTHISEADSKQYSDRFTALFTEV